LSQRVHLSKAQFAFYGLSSIIINALRRIGRTSQAGAHARNRGA
jgi:hypothetical protein